MVVSIVVRVLSKRGGGVRMNYSALRSGPVRFLYVFLQDRDQTGPRSFQNPKKTGPEPVKTDENRFKLEPVRTGPGINVLKHSLNYFANVCTN